MENELESKKKKELDVTIETILLAYKVIGRDATVLRNKFSGITKTEKDWLKILKGGGYLP